MYYSEIEDLSIFVCMDCGNFFYTYELPLGINDPRYCPYCGIDFNETIEESDLEC
jgi:rubrerythrin